MKKLLFFIILLFTSSVHALSQDDLLKPDVAFQISEPSYDSSGNLNTSWKIADEYYLYKKTFKFESKTDNIEFGDIAYPKAEKYRDITEGKMVDIFKKQVALDVPVKTKDGSPLPASIQVEVTHQGCFEGGVCYPPKKNNFTLALQESTGSVAPNLSGVTSDTTAASDEPATSSSSSPVKNLLQKIGLGNNKTIPVDEAFQFSLFNGENNSVTAHFAVTPGHYIYKEKIKFKLVDAGNLTLGEASYPKAIMKDDATYGEIEVYETDVDINVPLSAAASDQAQLHVEYQGCSDLTGVCYPPVKITTLISSASAAPAPVATATPATDTQQTNATPPAQTQTEQGVFADKLKNSSFLVILTIFFVAGLGLALTPCVFPMIPILSGIIAGQSGYLSTRKAFFLSLAYVIPMAATYAIVGVIAGLSGGAINLQVIFQDPIVLGVFAFIFVLLSLSMFGFYDLQMPSSIQTRLTEISNRQEGGSYIGASIMGVLSAIIVGPCVTAPLIGALVYIAQTNDAILGGSALFALGMGMGTPLLIIGTSAGKLLPRAGAWMDITKAIFGVMMLGLAIWMLDRVIPGEVTLLLTSILLIVSSIYTGTFDKVTEETSNAARFFKGVGIIMFTFGLFLLLGAATGSTSLTKPLQGISSSLRTSSNTQLTVTRNSPFQNVKGTAGLDAALLKAGENKKITMLDFWAEWCISCKEWEHITFQDSRVISSLESMVKLKTDVTADDKQDRALLQKFGLFGPPAILFFSPDGKELKNYRLVGFYPPDEFLAHLDKVRAAAGV